MSRSNPLPQTERRDSLARSSHPTLRHGRDGSGGAPTWSALGSALATIAMLLSADVACAQAWQREATRFSLRRLRPIVMAEIDSLQKKRARKLAADAREGGR